MDQDQKDTLASTLVVVLFVLIGSLFLPPGSLLAIFPVQFIVTYCFFCSNTVARRKNMYVDYKSGKRWKVSLSATFPGVGAILIFFAVALALSNQQHSKLLYALMLLSPLLLTRAIIFSRRLPLIALYPFEPTVVPDFISQLQKDEV
jgi:hypothetical protein